MQVDFKIGQGSLFPVLSATLEYGDGTLVPLNTGTPTVTFTMRREGYPTAKVVSGAVNIVDAVNSKVQYPWAAGDTSEPGLYLGYFTITYASPAKPVMVPSDGRIYISVVPT